MNTQHTLSTASCSTNVYAAAYYLYVLQSCGWVLRDSGDSKEALETHALSCNYKRAEFQISERNYVAERGEKTVHTAI